MKIFLPCILLLLSILVVPIFANMIQKEIYFPGTNQASRIYIYKNNIFFQSKFYSNKGKLMSWYQWQPLDSGNWIKEKLDLDSGVVIEREEVKFAEGIDQESAQLNNTFIVKKWHISDDFEKKPTTIDLYNIGQKEPVGKYILDENNNTHAEIKYYYKANESKPYKYEEYINGVLVHDYEMYEQFSPEEVWKKEKLSNIEIEKRRTNLNRKDKFLVAVIDSGFDYNHESLAHQWYINPKDPLDGIDNDGNGWIDDTLGWERELSMGLPSESTTAMHKNWRPLSHGTHVAHIATRNLWGVGLIGFSGDYTKSNYIKRISRFIKDHKVRVVNMSFGLPADIKNEMGFRETNKELKNLVSSNPNTLFVTASGNSIPGVDIDLYRNYQYPANIEGDNIIKVGSINSDRIDINNFDDYVMSDFSNFGSRFVDILAPGDKVSAASLGGGEIVHSGTSMATPYMANEIVQLWQKYPELTANEVKEVFIDSAYTLPSAPLVKTNGVVFRLLAEELAKKKMIELRWQHATSREQKKSGPNCWNSALYLAGVTNGLRYVRDDEFRTTIESPLCEMVSEPKYGDVVALRRTSSSGVILKYSLHSEVHGYTYLDTEVGLTKNGQGEKTPYLEDTHENILKIYHAASQKDCRIQGIPKEYCHLRTQYYRCQSMSEFMVKNPLESDRLFSFYQELETAEMLKEKESFIDLSLEVQTPTLPDDISDSIFGEIFSLRKSSLDSKF